MRIWFQNHRRLQKQGLYTPGQFQRNAGILKHVSNTSQVSPFPSSSTITSQQGNSVCPADCSMEASIPQNCDQDVPRGPGVTPYPESASSSAYQLSKSTTGLSTFSLANQRNADCCEGNKQLQQQRDIDISMRERFCPDAGKPTCLTNFQESYSCNTHREHPSHQGYLHGDSVNNVSQKITSNIPQNIVNNISQKITSEIRRFQARGCSLPSETDEKEQQH